jgi:uncharacterized MAPEG superfamily protein
MLFDLNWKLEAFAAGLPPEVAALLWSALLGGVHLVVVGQLHRAANGWMWTAGPRDIPGIPLSGVAGRIERAFRNYLETYPFFVAAVLAATATDTSNALTQWGAFSYVMARIVYVPLYASGIPLIRSLAWNVAFFGVVVIACGVVIARTTNWGA